MADRAEGLSGVYMWLHDAHTNLLPHTYIQCQEGDQCPDELASQCEASVFGNSMVHACILGSVCTSVFCRSGVRSQHSGTSDSWSSYHSSTHWPVLVEAECASASPLLEGFAEAGTSAVSLNFNLGGSKHVLGTGKQCSCGSAELAQRLVANLRTVCCYTCSRAKNMIMSTFLLLTITSVTTQQAT